MKDVVNEALKLDPHHIMDIPGRPVDNFEIYDFKKIAKLDIKSISVQLMNLIITTDIYPLVVVYVAPSGAVHSCALFVEGNTVDEMLDITEGVASTWMFSGYALPKNNDLIKMRAYHGKFYRK